MREVRSGRLVGTWQLHPGGELAHRGLKMDRGVVVRLVTDARCGQSVGNVIRALEIEGRQPCKRRA
jgi:hypothetical protein